MDEAAGSLGPSVWAVSDGRAGNAIQARAVAQALGETSRWMRIAHINGTGHRDGPLTLTPHPPWTFLPPGKWPAPRLALPMAQSSQLMAPWPNVWIGAGRRTAPYSRVMREWSGGESLIVHILDPRIEPSEFDILVAPAHDEVDGDNVISTIGSPAYFAPDAIEEAGQAFADLADERGKSAIVVLGGKSKTHAFTDEAATRLAEQLTLLSGQGWRLRITASRRTPVPIRATFRALADEIGARYWDGSPDGPNPYLAWLIFSDVAIVTEDSANMLSDAAYHGLPIHIARLEGKSAKFARLHQSFIDRGCARWFEGRLDKWEYEPLREADRVADVIVERLLERHPQPDIPAIEGDGKVVRPDWL
jgi:mitochondrial fission protein ELM1